MQRDQIIAILKAANVMRDGHFILTSGKHSDHYMQCAQLFQYPGHSEQLCHALVETLDANHIDIDITVGPAVGGIVMAFEMARQLGVRAMFAERENGAMTLRRGFAVQPGERVLVCEDVVTTGGSVKEVIALLQAAGAQVVGVASIVDRSKGTASFGCPFFPVIDIDFEAYDPADCPLCKTGSQAVKPGSRGMQ